MCVAINFINDFGGPFKLYPSLKRDGYLVNASEFKLKFMVDRPELHNYVEFIAQDLAGKNKLLLNGKPSIFKQVVPGCPIFWNVTVSSQKGNCDK